MGPFKIRKDFLHEQEPTSYGGKCFMCRYCAFDGRINSLSKQNILDVI
jgi:hypothetical protein